MPDIAQKITIDLKQSKVFIDGTEFPWLIAQKGPDVEQLPVAGEEIGLVSIPIFADSIEVIPADED